MGEHLVEESTGIVINFHGLNCECRDLPYHCSPYGVGKRGSASCKLEPAVILIKLGKYDLHQTLLPRLPPFPLIES